MSYGVFELRALQKPDGSWLNQLVMIQVYETKEQADAVARQGSKRTVIKFLT